jgi:hypothetical protein
MIGLLFRLSLGLTYSQAWAHKQHSPLELLLLRLESDVSSISTNYPLMTYNILSAILNIGFAYAFGLAIGIIIALGTSGAHLSPAITFVRILFEKFPMFKGVR